MSEKKSDGSAEEAQGDVEDGAAAQQDEDLDGYSDVGWGDRKPVGGDELGSLLIDPEDLEVPPPVRMVPPDQLPALLLG